MASCKVTDLPKPAINKINNSVWHVGLTRNRFMKKAAIKQFLKVFKNSRKNSRQFFIICQVSTVS